MSCRSIALAALDEALQEQIKLRFSIIFQNGAGSPEVLQRFQNGLRVLRAVYEQSIAIIEKEFPWMEPGMTNNKKEN